MNNTIIAYVQGRCATSGTSVEHGRYRQKCYGQKGCKPFVFSGVGTKIRVLGGFSDVGGHVTKCRPTWGGLVLWEI